jgi:hypothetical protein
MGNIARSTGCMVLHRPVELAPFLGSWENRTPYLVSACAATWTFDARRTRSRGQMVHILQDPLSSDALPDRERPINGQDQGVVTPCHAERLQ